MNARSWDGLARTVRQSVKGSSLDEMIQLHHGSLPVPKSTIPNVRRVVYTRVEDIPYLLKTDASGAAASGLRAEAVPFVPVRLPSELDGQDGPSEESKLGGEEDMIEEVVDMENIAQAIAAEQATVAAALSPEEVAAARTIAVAYQRHAVRLRSLKKNPMEEKRGRIFSAFFAQSQTMEWPHRYYRMLFNGPIPHLFIAVEGMKNHLYEARSVARKRFNVVKHLELENMKSSLTQMKCVPGSLVSNTSH